MQPLGHRVVIKPGAVHQQKNGIILPENSSELKEGEVMFIGTKAETVSMGDKILYPPNIGTDLEYNGEKVLIIDEGQIVVVL